MADEDLDEVCLEVLDALERGINIIRTDYYSASSQVKCAIIEGAEALLETCVGLEPLLLAPGDGITIVREFQTLVIRMTETFEQELLLEASTVCKGPGRRTFEIPKGF